MTDGDLAELRLLTRLHYGLAVLTALFPVITLPVFIAGVELLSTPDTSHPASRPAALVGAEAEEQLWRNVLGKLAVGGVAATTAICLVHAGTLGYIGGQIAARRRRWLVLIFSALHLINVPLGTALSIVTFTAFGRQRAKEAFGRV